MELSQKMVEKELKLSWLDNFTKNGKTKINIEFVVTKIKNVLNKI